MRSGFVSLIGRPNVGKSTLLNSIIGKKIAITSNKPQTTRNIIQGIYNEPDTQMVFVDTPGIHKPKYKLGKYLNKQAYYSINDVDVIVFIIDGSEKLGSGDLYVIEKLKEAWKKLLDFLIKKLYSNKEKDSIYGDVIIDMSNNEIFSDEDKEYITTSIQKLENETDFDYYETKKEDDYEL